MAILTPFREPPAKSRELGLLAKRGKPVFKDWPINEDEFLAYFP